MKKFDVEITETLQRKVSVEAASQEDAERMVTQAWNNQDYVLDSGDFTGVDFKTVGEHELAETRTMDVLLVQPNAYPKKISVGTELEDLQAMVGGDIEVTYPFEDEVAIILNESGKINGLPLNRAIYTEDGDMPETKTCWWWAAPAAARPGFGLNPTFYNVTVPMWSLTRKAIS